MNVRTHGHKILAAMLFLVFLFATSASSAWHGGWHGGWGGGGGWHHGWGGWGGGIYVGPSYYYHPYYSYCGWVGGHWRHGYWIPAHRVCWY